MKKKDLQKKLQLNKLTIASLNNELQLKIKGGLKTDSCSWNNECTDTNICTSLYPSCPAICEMGRPGPN